VTTRIAVTVIVVAGVALRLSAVGFGHHALTFQPDEDSNIPIALSLSWGNLNPHAFYYPDLSWYLLFLLNRLVDWMLRQVGIARDWGPAQYRALFDLYPIPFFLFGRTLSVAFGAATVALLYRLGRRLDSAALGMLAAGFLAVSFLHVRDSALATPDAPLTFFVLLALFGAVGILKDGRSRDYVIAAVGTGLATATKYNGILVVVALVVAHGLRAKRAGRRFHWVEAAPRLLLALSLAALIFLALDPYLFLDWPRAREGLTWQWNYSRTGQYMDIGPAWRYHLTTSLRYGMGVILLGLALGGMLRAAWRRERGELVLLSFVLVFFVEMSTLKAIFVRYMTPLIPILCLFAASAIVALAAQVKRPTVRVAVIGALVAVAILEPLHSSLAYARLVHHVDTRVQALEFLRTLPGGTDAATYGPSVTWRSTVPRVPLTFYAKPPDQPWEAALTKLRSRGIRYVLIHHSHLDVFSPTIPELEIAIRRAGTLVREFTPYAPGTDPHPVYDRVDAHFFPIGRFSAVVRPGPLVQVYRLND
jgi:hypothetical protein